MASIPSFIFGAGTKYKTQEELERAREQVKEMLGDIGQSGYTGWGSVMADLGKGIGARIEKGRIGEGQEFLTGEQSKLWDMFGGGGVGDIATAGGSDTAAGGGAQDAFFANPGGGVGGIDSYLANIRSAESGGNDSAKNPLSSASGRYQFTRGTWDQMRKSHPELGLTGDGIFDPAQQERAIRAFTADNASVLKNAGIPITGGTLYGAHFLGAGGARQAFRNPDDARMADVVGPGVVKANPFLRGMTVGDFKRWTAKKGGGGEIADLSGSGGSDTQAGGGAEDEYFQNRRRMTPEMLGKPSAPEEFNLSTRRRMTPAMLGTDEEPAPSAVPSPLDGRRRMTPAMLNPAVAPAPAPMPTPDPARFGPTPPVPVAAPEPLQAPNPDRFAPAAYAPPAPQIFTPPAAPRADRLGNPPPSMAGTETAPYPVPGQSMAGTERAPPQFAPTPAQPPVPTARANPVDPFTDMILGDQAKNYRPGGYIPPAPVASAFPVAPPAPGTPAAAGFGVPQQAMAGGGGSNTMVGQGGAFPPAPPAPGQQQAGGGDKIAKLMFIMSSPYASDEQKRMAGAMLQREYALQDETRKANTPEALLDRQYKRAQIADLQRKAAEGPGGEETWYGNPILTERDGKMVYGVFSNKGNFKELPMPEGTSVVPPTKLIHTKTEDILVDQAGNVISRTPIQNREAAAETAGGTVTGTADAERLLAAEPQIASANQALGLIEQIRNDPYLESGTGFSSFGNAVPGTGGYDFENLVKQAKSGAFLTAIPQLAGFGALSNTEGAAATAAIARLDTATSKEAFIKALDDYQAIINTGVERARRRLAEGGKTPPPAAGGGGGGAGTPPEGVSQRAWDKMTPEQRALWP